MGILGLVDLSFSGMMPSLEPKGLVGTDHRTEADYGMRSFPVLEELVIIDLPYLEKWLTPNMARTAFPNLRKLILNKCRKLTVMPEILSLIWI